MDRFEPGQIVRMKSGGPPMTVIRSSPETEYGCQVDCTWFSRESTSSENWSSDAGWLDVKTYVFNSRVLEKVDG